MTKEAKSCKKFRAVFEGGGEERRTQKLCQIKVTTKIKLKQKKWLEKEIS